mmetsp:Transcript_40460/g.100061  ORF Transcript_40460/g.100061 Transcript_40460/m.100061 type:complete len:397 (-) Transcript_40460:321-1511(-)
MAVADTTSGLSPVIVHAWLPKDALFVPEGGAPDRKALDALLMLIPERLKASQPYAKIKQLEVTIADNKAKVDAGETTAEEYDKAPEEELAGAMAAYDELATALCKGPFSTVGWLDSLMAYNTAGATTVIPGGSLSASDLFGAGANPLAPVSKVLAEFVKQCKLEKGLGNGMVVPAYVPNLFDGSSPVDGAVPWVDEQCALLGVESLDHVLLRWWDDKVPGVGEAAKALTATGKVGKVSLVNATRATLKACHVLGATPASVVLPAFAALAPASQALREDCALLGVPVVASDVLLGGLVSKKFVGVPEPNMAALAGPPAFHALGLIAGQPGGWVKFQALLKALGPNLLESTMVQLFVDAGMHAIVETELTGPPPFSLGEPLAAEQATAIVAAMTDLLG